MLRVTVELIRHGREPAKVLKQFDIINDGTGSKTLGNYRVCYTENRRVQARVKGHMRKAVSVMRLVTKAADALSDAWRDELHGRGKLKISEK